MSGSAPTILTSKFAKFNPFAKSKEDGENLGEAIDSTSIAGGGHSARQTAITKGELNVSHALRSFLVEHKVLSHHEAGLDSEQPTAALKQLLDRPHIDIPKALIDRTHPLAEYFISSSHNTYLLGQQLVGTSSATAYETALNTGARCVEIDAWDDEEDQDEPKVTHGYTLVSHIPFRSVCETIRDVVDKEAGEAVNADGYRAAPILLSLENHCGAHGQLRLVQIMEEVWGDRLLSKAVRDQGTAEQEGRSRPVTLAQLGSKIAVIVEYHLGGESEQGSEAGEEEGGGQDEDGDEEDEQQKQARREYEEKKKQAPQTIIIPELADLGVYAQSVKPVDDSWYQGVLKNGPHDHLINISETGLLSHLPSASQPIANHNAQHLMRVYPKGTRISSANLKPVPFWGIGAQICALNWQTFGASMQLNEALFSGSEGFVLKPAALRAGGSGRLDTGKKRLLRLHVAGASDLPVPKGREPDEIRPYLSCTLVHPDDLAQEPPKRKTVPYKRHKLGIIHRGEQPPPTDPIWDEVLEWEYEDNELVFLRMLIKSDDAFARNPMFAVAAVRLSYVTSGWTFVRLLDLKGRETHCTLLVKFDFAGA